MRRFIYGIMIALLITSAAEAQQASDLLQAALDSIGFGRADLGIEPKGYWSRFPIDIPYRVKSFDDLFAEPLRLYDFAKSFGGAVRRFCNPERLDSLDDNLYNLVYFLGVERKMGGFRSYAANLIEAPESEQPFLQAMKNLYLSAGRKMQFVTFGNKSDWPDYEKDFRGKIEPLSPEIRKILAALLENIREAIYWRDLGVRKIPHDVRDRVFQIRDLSETQGDAMVYYPEIDDAASTIDFESLCYAGLKLAAAAERAEKALRELVINVPIDYVLDFPTPYGRIVLTGRDSNQIDGTDCLLIVDFGGDDTYSGPIAATDRPDHGITLAIDLAGDDTYTQDDETQPSCGAGILGVGLLYDADGSDQYQGTVFSQGAGFLGMGILFDKSGDDDYWAQTSSQGAGYFGFGLCIDADGKDVYYIYGDGQGLGGVGGGIGCLSDYTGDDVYTAEPSSEIVNRGDYHSDFAINVNAAQGAGMGRRGDGSDGHSWAGGVGVIVDISGDDQYISGNWTLGCGYWFGTGVCYDGEGDDLYKSVYFTQASGAHFCNGVFVDESGDDRHLLYETAGAAFGFGWDYTNALFVDREGDDQYEAKMISYGLAQIRSFAFFFDMDGADTYLYNTGQEGFGAATFREDYAQPSELMTYYYFSKSAGIFIDASGTDLYWVRDGEQTVASEKLQNGLIWRSPDTTDANFGHDNYGIGIDAESGIIPDLKIFDTPD
ncbi:MAG: hypothetical protein ACFFEM_15510 [Candidatus Thorarchaeota archaeon]